MERTEEMYFIQKNLTWKVKVSNYENQRYKSTNKKCDKIESPIDSI